MFDVPLRDVSALEWKGDFPFDTESWNVGLIVGPSGCGKTTILRNLFGEMRELVWNGRAVIDDFDKTLSIEQIAEICQAVGFNTIPAWMRPYSVLSTGERFRVELARRMIESNDLIPFDEFSSVVDRQVAKIGAHAVQKYIRKHNRQFVAASCHYDVIEWLQPDWILEPATMSFTRRSLRRRPALQIEIARVPHEIWFQFAPFHYLTAELHKSARCFALFVDGRIASFGATIHRVHPRVRDVQGLSRLVTLPDWQGLGLAMILSEKLGAAYGAVGKRFHTYPAHPSLVRSFDKSPMWRLEKKPGRFSSHDGTTTARSGLSKQRPCAVFSYCGEKLDRESAEGLLNGATI